jgi:transposase
VITIPGSVRIFIGKNPIDMRKSIDGLMGVVQEELRQDAYSGHLFVFLSRRADRVKILAWDNGGFVLLYKRLERGQFKLPHIGQDTMAVEIDATQLGCCSTGSSSAASGARRTGGPHPRWIVQGVVPWTRRPDRDRT